MKVDLHECLALSRHAALKTRAEGLILVLPEQAIRIGGSGGEILQLCDGRLSGRQIVETIRARHPGDPRIEQEVISFLAEMQVQRAVVPIAKAPGPTDPGASS